MFGNAYQNGSYFEVWDSRVNAEKNPFYRQLFRASPSSLNKHYDKNIKSYIYTLPSQTSKIGLPADEHKELSLVPKFLVLQVFVPVSEYWSLELSLTDIANFKHRVNIVSGQGKQEVKYFSLRYPIDYVERGIWLFLGINVHSFMEAFKGEVFRSLDRIVVGGCCQLRRIFMMKEWNHWEIPKNYWFTTETPQNFQLIQYREQILPKISSPNKHMHSSEPLNHLYETPIIKKTEKKMQRSELHQPLTHSKVYNEYSLPQKPISLQPIVMKKPQKYRSKIQINSLKNEIGTSSELIQNSKNSQKKKPSKNSHKKILIQKSFQEDQALQNNDTSDQGIYTSHRIKTKQRQNQSIIEEEQIRAISYQKVHNPEERQRKNVEEAKKEELQLIYDEMVGCYYHPQSHTYFEVKKH